MIILKALAQVSVVTELEATKTSLLEPEFPKTSNTTKKELLLM